MPFEHAFIDDPVLRPAVVLLQAEAGASGLIWMRVDLSYQPRVDAPGFAGLVLGGERIEAG